MSPLGAGRETFRIITGHQDLVGNILCRRSSPSRSFVLATLRALHFDCSPRRRQFVYQEVLAACALPPWPFPVAAEGGRLPTKSAFAWIIHVVTARTEPTYGKRSRP